MVNEKTINSFKQNKIKYLVDDFAEYKIPEKITREILLKRGINKWLANRKAIINLKDELKIDIKLQLLLMKMIAKEKGKDSKEYKGMLGEYKATNYIRQRIRKICHTTRWQFPD